jgi:uncharacterized protein (UPF0335 family)
MTDLGHNTGIAPEIPKSNSQLQALVERIETVEQAVKELNEDKRDIYIEAKGVGYDVKVLRKVVALRRQDPDDRAEQEALMETYIHALGMLV